MDGIIRLVGPERSVELFGVKLLGVNAVNGGKLLLSLAFVGAAMLLGWGLRRLTRAVVRDAKSPGAFWTRQGVHIVTAAVVLIGVVSIWFDDPGRLAGVAGMVTAGIAFALQRVITAFAGYIVILRGNNFSVGDRIVMGGVRGDVVALGFMQTTIMEMGQPPEVQEADPAMWVRARQYTGRIVTVTNDKIFDTPVYNYSRDFPYIWEEMRLPIAYRDDRARAERILHAAAVRHSIDVARMGQQDLAELERRFAIKQEDLAPQVYWRLTDNWLELTVRFITEAHGVRSVKDRMSREVLSELEQAGIGIASATMEIVGLPPVRMSLERTGRAGDSQGR